MHLIIAEKNISAKRAELTGAYVLPDRGFLLEEAAFAE